MDSIPSRYSVNKYFLEAYRSGEIRDRGEIVDTPWCQLDHKVFDPLVGDPFAFQYEAYHNHRETWNIFNHSNIPLGFGNEQVGDMMISCYRAGILRDAGPLVETPQPNYDHAFSVKDGRMVVDWDALEVTKENALEISIASWKWTYQWMQDNGEKPEKGGDACALCYVRVTCQGCEIRDVARHCMYTPFPAYSDAETLHEALDACRDEIAFLEGLR
jgi:hypothetical protein